MTEQFTNIISYQYRGHGFMTIGKYNYNGSSIYIGDKESKKITKLNNNGISEFEGHCGVIWDLDITPDDRILVSCSGDLSIGFWDNKTLENSNKLIYRTQEKGIPKIVSIEKKLKLNLVAIFCESIIKKIHHMSKYMI